MAVREAVRDEPILPPRSFRDPRDGAVKSTRRKVFSPLSGKVIIDYDPETLVTVLLPHDVCDACFDYIEEKGDTHALDPIYFWGAGIFDYKSLQTPLGRKAYLNDEAMGRFIKYLPYELKRDWKKIVGLPFPSHSHIAIKTPAPSRTSRRGFASNQKAHVSTSHPLPGGPRSLETST